MRTTVAIVADDLTGALDTGTPFVEAGLRVVVALDPADLPDALAQGADVIVCNTASRGLPEGEAALRVEQAAHMLRAAAPRFLLKKIDSRLKGNVRAECTAMAQAFGRSRLLVAPAIPDQERHAIDGHVVGRGVSSPLPIAPIFEGAGLVIETGNGQSNTDMDRIIAAVDWETTLLIGARGIGAALARSLGAQRALPSFQASTATLFALGSLDPITATQMDVLEQSGLLTGIIEAPAGALEVITATDARLPLLLRCGGEMAEDTALVARRFASGVTATVARTLPDTVMMGGGDTALAILRELGIGILHPRGEVDPGIPWFEIALGDGREIRCAVKSGGFGNPHSLLSILNAAPKVRQTG